MPNNRLSSDTGALAETGLVDKDFQEIPLHIFGVLEAELLRKLGFNYLLFFFSSESSTYQTAHISQIQPSNQ